MRSLHDWRNPILRYSLHGKATRVTPRKGLKRRPFLGLHPGFAVPASVSANRNSSAAMRSRSGLLSAAWLRRAGGALVLPEEWSLDCRHCPNPLQADSTGLGTSHETQ